MAIKAHGRAALPIEFLHGIRKFHYFICQRIRAIAIDIETPSERIPREKTYSMLMNRCGISWLAFLPPFRNEAFFHLQNISTIA